MNPKGLDFYNRLIDELLCNYPYIPCFTGIILMISIAGAAGSIRKVRNGLQRRIPGLWLAAFSDRVAHWMTLNEPQCFIGLGHQNGVHAPGDKLRISASAARRAPCVVSAWQSGTNHSRHLHQNLQCKLVLHQS